MRALAGCVLFMLLQAGALAVPLPHVVRSEVSALREAPRLLGSAELRWFGIRIYDAALWVPTGTAWSPDGAFALVIRYARDIAGERLVATSIEEMRRMELGDEARLTQWRGALARALPSVAAGATLVGARVPGGGVRFWHDGRLTAELADADLARAFFAIWLDPRTREPAMRAQLLGAGADAR